VDNPVDNPVDILWISFDLKVIHILSTAYPQGYPQDKIMIIIEKSELSTENGLTNNNNLL